MRGISLGTFALVCLAGCSPLSCILLDGLQDGGDGNLSLAVVTPAEGELVTSPVTFELDWGDSESDADVRLIVEGREVGIGRRLGDAPVWDVQHDSGEIVVELHAESIATEHYGEAFATVRVEWQAPWLADLEVCPDLCRAPGGEAGTIRVLARPRWDAGRLASVTYALDGVELGTRAAPPFDLEVDTTAFTNGSHTLTSIVTDDAGNQANATANVAFSN